MYEVTCPSCQAKQSTPFVRFGAVTDCPACGHRFCIGPEHVQRRMLVYDPVADAELVPPAAPPQSDAGRREQANGAGASRGGNGGRGRTAANGAGENAAASGQGASARGRGTGGGASSRRTARRATSRRTRKGPDVALWTAIVSGVAMIVIVVALIARFLPGEAPPVAEEDDPFLSQRPAPSPGPDVVSPDVPEDQRLTEQDSEVEPEQPYGEEDEEPDPPRGPDDQPELDPDPEPDEILAGQQVDQQVPDDGEVPDDPDREDEPAEDNGMDRHEDEDVTDDSPDVLRPRRLLEPEAMFIDVPGPWHPILVMPPALGKPAPDWAEDTEDPEGEPEIDDDQVPEMPPGWGW